MDGSSYHTLLYPRTNGSFTPSLDILKGTKKAIMVLPEVMTVQRGYYMKQGLSPQETIDL